MKKNDSCILGSLKSSRERVGRLYPVLIDFHGKIIDGQHRLEADKAWPRRRLEYVKTEKQRMVARLISNSCRRTVRAKEKREILDNIGEILLREGIQPGEISMRIAEETGMSYTWVMKYLPEKYKEPLHSATARAPRATRCVASSPWLLKILNPPREKLVAVAKYQNANHVLVTIRKSLYQRIERASELLNVMPDIVIQNILEERLVELAAIGEGVIHLLQRRRAQETNISFPLEKANGRSLQNVLRESPLDVGQTRS